MTETTLLSLAEQSVAIRNRTLSARQLTETYLGRIARLDEQLHSFNSLRAEAALAEATAADREIAHGQWRGPLHGVAIGIKDMIDVAGMPTTAQAVHRLEAIALSDAPVVASLKAAGAIIIGKQAMTEYAVGGTQLDHAWPPARNPWNLDMDALSSSSGSSVSVAAGLCAGSVGTETAGSIRDPAAWNGVAGLCPTVGLTSRTGVLPLSPTMDTIGPIAWTVEDCALLLAGMVSTDPKDIHRPGFRAPDLADLRSGIAGLRIGVVRDYFENDPDYDPAVLAAMDHSLDVLNQLGARLGTAEIGDFERYGAIARAISWPEEYEAHRDELEQYPDRFTAVSRSRLLDGRAYSAADYLRAQRQRRAAIADFNVTMNGFDVLVLPTTKKPAQPVGFEFTELGNVELSLSRPFNLLGVPSLALCNGFSPEGLPLSIQLVGRAFDEAMVLRVGHALETALGLRTRRPPVAIAS
jgi:aspartyl-tRNA(Asn)/glutamyl-tRNA(Gln) amidotransferase subunit A